MAVYRGHKFSAYFNKKMNKDTLMIAENCRFIGKGNRLIRSSFVSNLSKKAVEFLFKLNITNLIDLRSTEEVLKHPCGLTGEFNYKNLPLCDDGRLPHNSSEVAEFYYKVAEEKIRVQRVLKAIANTDSGTVIFCRSGKDRTGIISALLLSLGGYSDEYISRDYTLSQKNLQKNIDSYLLLHPEYERDALSPCEKHIFGFLDKVRSNYTDIINYCREIGLTEQEISSLRNKVGSP
jgi:protein-tyrosine phosphatase